MGFIFFLFVVIVGGCWLVGRILGNAFFKDGDPSGTTFIDRSVHHHYHDNRSVNMDGETFRKLKK